MVSVLRFARRLARVLHYISAYVGVPLLIALIIYDVFLRYVLLDPSLWANEVSAVLLILVVFASLPKITIERQHLGSDLIYLMVGRTGKRVTAIAGYFCGAVFGCTFAFLGYTSSLDALNYAEGTQNVAFPYWPFYAVMTVSAAIVALICLLQIVATLTGDLQDSDTEQKGLG